MHPSSATPTTDGDHFAAEPAATTDRADPDPVGDVSPEHDHADGHACKPCAKALIILLHHRPIPTSS